MRELQSFQNMIIYNANGPWRLEWAGLVMHIKQYLQNTWCVLVPINASNSWPSPKLTRRTALSWTSLRKARCTVPMRQGLTYCKFHDPPCRTKRACRNCTIHSHIWLRTSQIISFDLHFHAEYKLRLASSALHCNTNASKEINLAQTIKSSQWTKRSCMYEALVQIRTFARQRTCRMQSHSTGHVQLERRQFKLDMKKSGANMAPDCTHSSATILKIASL